MDIFPCALILFIDHLLSNVLILYVIKACGHVEQNYKTETSFDLTLGDRKRRRLNKSYYTHCYFQQ
jgi:hypothetical protein